MLLASRGYSHPSLDPAWVPLPSRASGLVCHLSCPVLPPHGGSPSPRLSRRVFSWWSWVCGSFPAASLHRDMPLFVMCLRGGCAGTLSFSASWPRAAGASCCWAFRWALGTLVCASACVSGPRPSVLCQLQSFLLSVCIFLLVLNPDSPLSLLACREVIGLSVLTFWPAVLV